MMHALNDYDFLQLCSYDDETAFFAQMGRFFASATVRRDCGGYPLNDGPRHRWFIVRLRGHARVLGFVSIELLAGTARIRDGYIRPEARRRGLFRALLQCVLDYIDERGLPCAMRVPRDCVAPLLPHGFHIQTTRGNWVTLKRNTHATHSRPGEPDQNAVQRIEESAFRPTSRSHQPNSAMFT